MNPIGIFLHKLWNGFLWFRKRFFPLRLIILLAILTLVIAERVCWPHPSKHYLSFSVQELVYIACEAIRAGSEPKVVHSQLGYDKAEACAELKRKLAPLRDRLPPGLLDRKPKDSDLPAMYAQAVRLRIEPYVSQNYKTFRRKLSVDAQVKTDRRFSPAWAEVEEDIFRFQGWNLRESFTYLYLIFTCFLPLGYVIPLAFAVLAGYVLFYKKSRWLLWGLPLGVYAYTLAFSPLSPIWTLPKWLLLSIFVPQFGFVAAAVLLGIRLREKGVPFGRFLVWFFVLTAVFLCSAEWTDFYWYSSFRYSWKTILPYLIPGIVLLGLPLRVRRMRIPFRKEAEHAPGTDLGKDD